MSKVVPKDQTELTHPSTLAEEYSPATSVLTRVQKDIKTRVYHMNTERENK